MGRTRRDLILYVAAAFACGAPAAAQTYPTRPITLVAPFPAGGSTDAIARIIGQEMSKGLGQQVVVDNKPGANGNVGSAAAARATPDGYTLLLTGVGSNAINHSLYAKMAYDSRKDFANITLLTTGPNVLLVNANVPAKDLKELVALAKANPGKYDYGSSGVGSSGHLAMEMLKQRAGIQATHVPYRGGAPALNDLIAGQIPMMFVNQDVAKPHVDSGKLRAIGVTSLARNPLYPDTPTIAEHGFPGFEAVSWFGLSAPAGTPKEALDRLHAEAVKALKSESVRDKLVANGFVVSGNSPEDFARFVASEIEKWKVVVEQAGAKLD